MALALEPKLVVEIRQGVGGLEASLFAEQLLKMYERFALKMCWSAETICVTPAFGGGVKEASILIAGEGSNLWLKHEAGVHRVQRVPRTETRGRVHTSTATVAVLPAASDGDQIEIATSDLKVETMRSTGAGGQHVNTTDSAVRITHLPTGTTACCSQRSQHQNRAKAMAMLKHRLVALSKLVASCNRAQSRRAQIGSGDRTEKMRTYSFMQDKVTDHKRKVVASGVNKILNGDLKLFVTKLMASASSS
ncbi:peptide chain release factor-like protein [Candidatus Hodgkinia cicadicola]